MVQIRPTGVLHYEQLHWLIAHSRKKNKGQDNFKPPNEDSDSSTQRVKQAYSGDMSAGSIKRAKRAIQLLLAISKPKKAVSFKTGKEFTFRVNFITLTLPAAQEDISDKVIKKEVLEPFLRILRKKYQLKSYIWKAERQLNGNIHFHLTTDTYILYYRIRDEWNKCLAKLGFIERFRDKWGHSTPNSTDIHAVHKIDNLAGYMIKYMCKGQLDKYITKADKNASSQVPLSDKGGQKIVRFVKKVSSLKPIEGKVWDCSANLKAKIRCEFEMDSKAHDQYNELRYMFAEQLKKTDQCEFIWMTEKQLLTSLPKDWKERYITFLSQVRNYKSGTATEERKHSGPANEEHEAPPF